MNLNSLKICVENHLFSYVSWILIVTVVREFCKKDIFKCKEYFQEVSYFFIFPAFFATIGMKFFNPQIDREIIKEYKALNDFMVFDEIPTSKEFQTNKNYYCPHEVMALQIYNKDN